MRRLLTTLVLLSMLAAVAAAAGNPLYTGSVQGSDGPLYHPVSAATITVVQEATTAAAQRGEISDGMYVLEQDGDDLLLRKRPGRTTFGDITLKKGHTVTTAHPRCVLGGQDCPAADAAYRMNKAELVEAIASKSGLSGREPTEEELTVAERALDLFAANVPPGHITVLKARATVTGAGPFVVQWRQAARDADSDGDGFGDCPGTTKAREKAKRTACETIELAVGYAEIAIAGDTGGDLDGDGLYDVCVSGNDMVVRKKPGRTTYKGAGGGDCDDTDTDVFPGEVWRMDLDRLGEGLAADSGLSKADAKRALEAFADSPAMIQVRGDELRVIGSGSFSISKRDARKGRNPQTGKEIQIPAKNVATVKAGSDLADKVKAAGGTGAGSDVTGEIILEEGREMRAIEGFPTQSGVIRVTGRHR